MKPLINIATWLDKKQFFNYRLWEFSLRNSRRFFPYYFLFRILLIHPRTAWHGIRRYQHLVRTSQGDPLLGTIALDELPGRFADQQNNHHRFIIAPGFCMKPYNETKHRTSCPVGHFNHDCLMFENSSLLLIDQETWQHPCNTCNIGVLAHYAAKLRSDFYIMTSALDIARDLFLPAIKGNGARRGVFLLCPYSTEAFTWGLATCGIDGAIVTFCQGDCQNHDDFTKADIGIKDKQTFVEPKIFDKLLNIFNRMTELVSSEKTDSVRYIQRNNVYQCEHILK